MEKKLQIFGITTKRISLPLVQSKVQAGFPVPAENYIEDQLDINDIVAANPASTFYVKVKGDSMQDANIHEGDILVVNRSAEPSHGKIVIAIIDGEFTVKQLYSKDNEVKLLAANPEYPDIIFRDEQELNIWGVVSYIIYKV